MRVLAAVLGHEAVAGEVVDALPLGSGTCAADGSRWAPGMRLLRIAAAGACDLGNLLTAVGRGG